MEKLKSLLAGFAGSVALNLLHEGLRRTDSRAPRIDKIGKEALSKTIDYFGAPVPGKKKLYEATLASDLVGNAFYYSLIGAGDHKYLWPRSIVYGLLAGAGTLELPEPMGLDPMPVNRTTHTKVLTAGYYLFGALVTAGVISLLRKR